MKTYQQFITEMFDKPAELNYTVNTKGRVKANSTINGKRYHYTMEALAPPVHAFYFSDQEGGIALNNKGDAIPVMSTAIKFLNDYYNKVPKGTQIYFTASNSEPSRVKLYNKMASILGRKHKYNISIEPNNELGHTEYIITK